jgi:hypothetical protein
VPADSGPQAPQAPSGAQRIFAAHREKCFWCVTVLQLSVEYSGQPDPGVKSFRKAGLTRGVVLTRTREAAISLVKVSCPAKAACPAQGRVMKLS